MTRRRYSAEVKREAVAMARSPGVTLRQVGEDLGISAHLLGRWRKLLDEDGALTPLGVPLRIEVRLPSSLP